MSSIRLNIFCLVLWIFNGSRDPVGQSKVLSQVKKESHWKFLMKDVNIGMINDNANSVNMEAEKKTFSKTSDDITTKMEESTTSVGASSSKEATLFDNVENITTTTENAMKTETELWDLIPEEESSQYFTGSTISNEISHQDLTVMTDATDTLDVRRATRTLDEINQTDAVEETESSAVAHSTDVTVAWDETKNDATYETESGISNTTPDTTNDANITDSTYVTDFRESTNEYDLKNTTNVSDATSVSKPNEQTDVTEVVPITTKDSLLQILTSRFLNASKGFEFSSTTPSPPPSPPPPTDIQINFQQNSSSSSSSVPQELSARPEFEELFDIFFGKSVWDNSTEITVENMTLKEAFLVVLSEIDKNFAFDPLKTEKETKWKQEEEKEGEGDGEGKQRKMDEEEEKKSTSNNFGNGRVQPDPGCGVPKRSFHSRKKRIVGGTRVVYGQLPWLVSLHFRGEHPFINKTGFNHLCGASLIHPQWLVSAAHCFNPDVSDNVNMSKSHLWYAVVGENSLNGEESTEKIVEIEKIIAHKQFTFLFKVIYDIALIKLSEPIEETDFIRIVCLDTEKGVSPGEICTVAGWGLHSAEGNGSAHPFQASVEIISNFECQKQVKHLSELEKHYFSESNTTFCAVSDKGADSCYGDSGGPLQCYRNGRWYLTGVISAGYKCGEVPGLYSRIGFFIDWIDRNMNEN